jgi:NADH:ubiquinone reductase (H+-translocating)
MLQRALSSAQWEQSVPGLKCADDVAEVGRRVRLAFEYAESEPDPDERTRLLTFVIVGGSESGIRMAAVIAGLVRETVSQQHCGIAAEETEVVLIERGDRLSHEGGLEQHGITVLFGAPVTDIAADHVIIGGRRLDCRTCVWADRIEALPVRLGVEAGRSSGTADRLSRFRNSVLALGARLWANAAAWLGAELMAGSR